MRHSATLLAMAALLVGLSASPAVAKKDREKKKTDDPYAAYVWPPPPDKARIQLEAVLSSRADVEGRSRLRRILIGASPETPYDRLRKPFAVAFDAAGRILVTDSETGALLRFDRDERRLDVFGTTGVERLRLPLGLAVGEDGTIFVADGAAKKVLAYDQEGTLRAVFGRAGELTNPTDSAPSPDGRSLYVADSKAHKIVVFDLASGRVTGSFGNRGEGAGEFSFPTSLAFSPEGNLLVVDQANSRVQLFAPDGEYLDEFGGRGVGFANFVRPKDVAVDEVGFIYVTDNAFNNVQLFDVDFALLTYVGQGGRGPGEFHGASGIAVRGDQFAVVDQIGRRLQLFRFIVPKGEPLPETRRAAVPPTPAAVEPPTRRVEAPAASGIPSTTTATGATSEVPVREAADPAGRPAPQPATAPAGAREPVARAAPPAAAPEVEPEAPAAQAREQVARFVAAWRRAWTEQRVEDYLESYAPEFRPADGGALEDWRELRRLRLTRPRFIRVEIAAMEVEILDEANARVTFVQSYRSDRFADRVQKTLELTRSAGGWAIAAERVDLVLE